MIDFRDHYASGQSPIHGAMNFVPADPVDVQRIRDVMRAKQAAAIKEQQDQESFAAAELRMLRLS